MQLPWATAASPPEGPHLDEVPVGLRRVRHRLVDPGILAPGQHAGRKGALAARMAPPGADRRHALLMYRDIVEVAESVLQALQRRRERLATLGRSPAVEQVAEEFRAITQLLGLDAQLVTASRIEPLQRLAALANLAPAPRQLISREALDRNVAAIAHEVVLRPRPFASLQPFGDGEGQGAESFGPHRILC